MKKDIFVRSLRVIIGLSLVGYVIYLFSNGGIIVKDFVSNFNQIYLGLVGFIGLFIFVMGISGLCVPRPRLIQFLFGMVLVLFSHYFLQDNPSKFVFLADILNVLGVFLMIAGPLGFCITENCKKKIEESKIIEIIEV